MERSSTRPRSSNSREHCSNILNTLNSQRHDTVLCDVTLVVQDTSYPAHRCILAANSPYFQKLFTSDMAEKAQEIIRVELEQLQISRSVMDDLLYYFYTGNLNIYTSTAQDLLVVGDYFLITDLKNAASDFMENMLSEENCLLAQALADRYNSEHLCKAAKLFIEKNFSVVCKTVEFLELPYAQLQELLSNDELVLNEENEVLDSIFSWVNYSPRDRKNYFDKLFSQVRLVSFSSEQLDKLLSNEFIQNSDVCSSLINQLVEARLSSQVEDTGIPDPRKCLQPPLEVVVTCGGMSLHYPNHSPLTRCYVPETNKWYEMKAMASRRNWHGCTTYGECLYAVGGEVDGTVTASCQKFDFVKNSWENFAPLLRPTIFPAVAEMHGKLYVIGGVRNNRARLQVYDPVADTWTYGTCLSVAREITCAVAKPPYLYAIGGLQSDLGTYMNSVEKYHPDFDCWISIRDMIQSRAGATGVTLNNCIYVVGGEHDLRMAHATCEQYFIAYDEWQMITSMRVPRYFAGAAVIGQGFYVFGGVGGTNVDLSDKLVIEYYDAKTDSWKSDMEMPWSERYFRCGTIWARKHLLRGLSLLEKAD